LLVLRIFELHVSFTWRTTAYKMAYNINTKALKQLIALEFRRMQMICWNFMC